jgi:hypothetical protein
MVLLVCFRLPVSRSCRLGDVETTDCKRSSARVLVGRDECERVFDIGETPPRYVAYHTVVDTYQSGLGQWFH